MVEVAAKADNYDYIFNKSASVSNVPFLLYSKDAVDITDTIAATINKDAPVKEEE